MFCPLLLNQTIRIAVFPDFPVVAVYPGSNDRDSFNPAPLAPKMASDFVEPPYVRMF